MYRVYLVMLAALVAVLAGSAVGDAAQQAAQAPRTATGDEYVVMYDAAGGAAAAEQAITAAGGTVVDRNDALGLVLVDTENAAFAGQVRQGQGVAGVALNHSIGTDRQGMPHRFAEERPAAAVAGNSSGGLRSQGQGRARAP